MTAMNARVGSAELDLGLTTVRADGTQPTRRQHARPAPERCDANTRSRLGSRACLRGCSRVFPARYNPLIWLWLLIVISRLRAYRSV